MSPLAVSMSVPLTIDTRPPPLVLVSLYPLRLKTDERVSVTGVVNGQTFKTSEQPGVFRLAWRGAVRSLRIVARDAAGNGSKPVTYPRR